MVAGLWRVDKIQRKTNKGHLQGKRRGGRLDNNAAVTADFIPSRVLYSAIK